MTRPWLIWLLSLCCAAGIFGAMGLITHRSLRVEQEGAQARADAELQERLRLALWRMETDASTLMIEENNRPPEHFRAVPNTPSPLAGPLPKHVRLHFDISADGSVTSPQVPQAGDARFQMAEKSLQHLRTMLARSPSMGWCSSVMRPESAAAKPASRNAGSPLDNALFLDAAARNRGPFEQVPVPNLPPPGTNETSNDTAQNGATLQQVLVQSPASTEAMKQQGFNANEMNKRAQVYTKVAEGKNYLQSVPQSSSASAPAKEKEEYADQQKGAAKPASTTRSPSQLVAAQKEAQSQEAAAAAPAAPAVASAAKAQAADAAAGQQSMAPTSTWSPSTSQQSTTPFRPFWLENELFLVREVAEAGRRHVQGVWLDAVSLRASLLESVADILPRASLQAVASVAFVPMSSGQLMPSPASASGDPMSLVGLPWKLVPGETAIAVVQGWTPMRLTLAAAWLGVLLAALAAAALLFGVTRLSERRAAFVSSVTHELRTPLTTFRLYSELLEQGMVREEADRTQYLHTLRMEAERLTHLVDNVLAYSRIERTNRRSRMERLELAPWMERVRGRLEDRTREAGMTLDLQLPARDSEMACVTDATALEQIVFNLVDNACKYAAGRCAEPVVRVGLGRRGRWAELRVCDTGPGIARGERSRLFRPFHKSADEAANSKPGVGLGLALCHRLARALGGKLMLDKPRGVGPGACFVLRLPMA